VIFTGERVIPGEGDEDLLNEHLARYWFAQRFSSGNVVLDAACGSGYGAALLGANAKCVFGVDISQEAVEYSRTNYRAPNVQFSVSDCMALPFAAAYFDLVVAFEIIEHVTDPEAFLNELDRVLNPSGLLILSTPNRLYYTGERGEINPFHCREFSFPELDEILQPFYPHRAILLENHVPGVVISGADTAANSGLPFSVVHESPAAGLDWRTRPGEEAARQAYYFVVVCSHRPLEAIPPLLYLPTTGNVLQEREKHIRQLTEFLAKADAETERARAETMRITNESEDLRRLMDAELERVRTEIEQLRTAYESRVQELDREVQELKALVEERTQWARNLDHELAEKGDCIAHLQGENDRKTQWAQSLAGELEEARAALQRLQQEFDERTAWALQLDAELKRLQGELTDRSAELSLLYGSRWYRIGKNLRLSPIPPSDRK